MSGKHDKKAEDEQAANLLLTGPIAIRGLGRGVKDALLPGRPSRHRAFIGDGSSMDGGVETRNAAPALPDTAAAAVVQPAIPAGSFPRDVDVAQTQFEDSAGEDRVDDRPDDERSADTEVDRPGGLGLDPRAPDAAGSTYADEPVALDSMAVVVADGLEPPDGSEALVDDPARPKQDEVEGIAGFTVLHLESEREEYAPEPPVEAEQAPIADRVETQDDRIQDATAEDGAAARPAEDELEQAEVGEPDLLASAPAVVDVLPPEPANGAEDRSDGDAQWSRPLRGGRDALDPTDEAGTKIAEPVAAVADDGDGDPAFVGVTLEELAAARPRGGDFDVREQDERDANGVQTTEPDPGRTWTTAEELFSGPLSTVRPASAPAEPPKETVDASAVATAAVDEPTQSARGYGPGDETASKKEAVPAAPVKSRASRPTAGQGGGSRPPRRPVPLRDRFGRGTVGIAVLVLLALICGGLITAVVLKTQRDASIAAEEAANYTPPPLATPKPVSSGPLIAIVGDGAAISAAPGVTTAKRWPALLGDALGGTVNAHASSGMGYLAKGKTGQTFVQEAAAVPANADVVVFFGGAADANVSAFSLVKAATDAFAAAGEQAPGAKLLVVGPAIADEASETDLSTIRTSVRSAAGIASATWIDPMDKNWLSSAKQAGKPSELSASNERTLSSKLASAVKTALQ